MNLGVSVLICTYNGAERIGETLKHLALQQFQKPVAWEVIIVNNASTDLTVEIAEDEWLNLNGHSIGLRIIEQLIPGKNHALNKGFQEAQYEYIIICDDDNWLYPNYIETALDVMENDPCIAVLGGCGIFEPEQPMNTEIENYRTYYVNGSQKWAPTMHWVYGAGSVYRKSVFIDLIEKNWKLVTPGRVGKRLNGGEDVEFCFIAYLIGYKIIASDELLFRHFVPFKRQNVNYIIDLCYWASYTNVLLISYYSIIHKDKRPIATILDTWFWGISKTLIKQLILHACRKLKIWKKITTEERITIQSIMGTFFSLLNNRSKIIKHSHHLKKILFNEVV